jgi:hypothetical protein
MKSDYYRYNSTLLLPPLAFQTYRVRFRGQLRLKQSLKLGTMLTARLENINPREKWTPFATG